MAGAFKLMAEVQPEDIPSSKFYKWKSSRTGMQVVLITRKSPSVQATVAVATEANDNSGCPHTLEHIVFMGSKKFPYKGLLDKVAVQQLSNINAFTAQDQTCYTVTTAGYEGFFNTLPVFLDNILHATVEESACLTEVYHIDGKGEEKGVVFCEMQGHEHTADTVVITEVRNLLYNPDSGYATNTGGRLSALRELEPKTIKQYHRDVYRPENLSIVVSGDIEPEQLMEVIEKFDAELPQTTERKKRPFVDSAASNAPCPLKGNVYSTVEFPDSSESHGQILISWVGPQIRDIVGGTAMEVMRTYLATQDAGKLERKFVAVEKNAAIAADVYAYSDAYLNIQVNIWLSGVPTPRGDFASHEVVKYLETELLNTLDFEFLKQCIDTVYDEFIMGAENAWETLGVLAVTEFLYGDDTTFTSWLADIDEFKTLKSWSKEDWCKFITEFIIKPAKACVFGKPSKSLTAKIDQRKKDRRREIKRTRNLEAEAEKLKLAVEKNEAPIPEELLKQFPAPNYSNIRFITSETAATQKLISNMPGKQLIIDESLQQLLAPEISGLALDFEQVKSQFVSLDLFISTQAVDKRLYPLVYAVLSRIFSMPMVLDDGTKLSSDEVVLESKRDVLTGALEVHGQLQEFVSLRITTRMEKYSQAMMWLSRVILNVVFDEDNVAMALGRHLKGLAEEKRTDSTLLYSSMDEFILTPESLRRGVDPLISEPQVLEFEENMTKTVEDLKLLMTQLFRKESIRGLVTGNLVKMSELWGRDKITEPWAQLAERLPGDNEFLYPPLRSSQFLTAEGQSPSKRAVVTLNAATDSTNLSIVAKGPDYYGHKDLLGLAVINAYLGALEGPLSIAVRGTGLAYGVYMTASVQMGSVECVIDESTDGLGAYQACKQVIEQIINGEVKITESEIASSVASVVNHLASLLADTYEASVEKFTDTAIKGYVPNYVYQIIESISKFTPSDFMELLRAYIWPVFDARTSMVFVVAPVSEEQKYKDGLSSLGYDVITRHVQVDDDSDEYDSDEYDSDSDGSDGSDESVDTDDE